MFATARRLGVERDAASLTWRLASIGAALSKDHGLVVPTLLKKTRRLGPAGVLIELSPKKLVCCLRR
jgi:hypothetical protein